MSPLSLPFLDVPGHCLGPGGLLCVLGLWGAEKGSVTILFFEEGIELSRALALVGVNLTGSGWRGRSPSMVGIRARIGSAVTAHEYIRVQKAQHGWIQITNAILISYERSSGDSTRTKRCFNEGGSRGLPVLNRTPGKDNMIEKGKRKHKRTGAASHYISLPPNLAPTAYPQRACVI